MKIVADRTPRLVPVAAQTVTQQREPGVKVSSCTGYTSKMTADISISVAEQGYEPGVASGWSAPLMAYGEISAAFLPLQQQERLTRSEQALVQAGADLHDIGQRIEAS